MSDRTSYEVVVVGGGPAGMTTAIYATRLGHRTAVFEKEGGRHAEVTNVHNLPGVSEDVSGSRLARHAAEQLEEYGGDYHYRAVTDIRPAEGGEGRFVVEAADTGEVADPEAAEPETTVEADVVVLATGFSDVDPPVGELLEYTGRGLFYCLHCDAYVLGGCPTFVMGHDDHAAEVAMLLLNVTDDVDLLLHGREPTWSDETDRQLRAHPVEVVETPVEGVVPEESVESSDHGGGPTTAGGESDPEDENALASEDPALSDAEGPWIDGLTFADGTTRSYLGGFAVYGTEYNTALASSLGCDLTDDGAVDVDEAGRTSVDGVFAVGDVTHGQNQTTVAIGDGAKAGMALHRDLRDFPVPLEDLEDGEAVDGSDVPAASGGLLERMRRVRALDAHAGLGSSEED